MLTNGLLLEQRLVFRCECVLRLLTLHAHCLGLQPFDKAVELFLLVLARRFARELRTKQIGIVSKTAHAHDKFTQCFAGPNLIHTRRDKLSLEPHEVSAACFRHANIIGGKNGNDIARQEQSVMLRVPSSYGFAEVERDQRRLQCRHVEPLDDGVIPVDLNATAHQAAAQFFGSDAVST